MGAMELEEKTVQIRDDFDPDKILESGQCFRPRKQAEGWYRFVSGRQLLYLRPLRSGTYTVRCEPGAWETFWHGYFDLGRSYAALRGKLDSRDDFLQRAMEYGRGIRVLRELKTDLPVITKPAAGHGIPLLELEGRCTDFFSLCRKRPLPCGAEWSTSPVIRPGEGERA